MRIVSWNVNSIRSRSERLFDWIERHQPDVALLQETKCTDATFEERCGARLHELGYEFAHHGRNHWNGVAIISRVGLAGVRRGFPGVARAPFDEARTISATCDGVEVHSIYAPNGRSLDDPHYLYKLVWLERLRTLPSMNTDYQRAGCETTGTESTVTESTGTESTVTESTGGYPPVILAGDFNVAPTDLDIYDPVRWRRRTHASAPERAAVDHLLDLGLIDVTRQHLPGPGVYTWWGYRPGQFELNRGLRIDLALVSPELARRTSAVWIDTAERADDRTDEKPSDHAPLVIELIEDAHGGDVAD